MPTTLRNAAALLAGIVVGSAVNMGLIMLGTALVPPPAGVNVNDMESMRSSIHLFEPRHFVMPFLAHALGTLAGAFTAYAIAATHKRLVAFVIGVVFLAGGIAASFMIPAPVWFIALDLLVAYIPMAWLATRIGARVTRPAAPAAAVA